MDTQGIIDSLDALQLDELRRVQARVQELIARLEAPGETPAPAEPGASASFQAYQDMKANVPEDLGQR